MQLHGSTQQASRTRAFFESHRLGWQSDWDTIGSPKTATSGNRRSSNAASSASACNRTVSFLVIDRQTPMELIFDVVDGR
jgi:hypothetical protein